MNEFTEIASGLRFPEGPVAMPDGSVILVEMFGGCITRVRPDGSKERVADIVGGPNGAAIGPDSALYLCNNGGCFTPIDMGGLLFPGAVRSGQLHRWPHPARRPGDRHGDRPDHLPGLEAVPGGADLGWDDLHRHGQYLQL